MLKGEALLQGAVTALGSVVLDGQGVVVLQGGGDCWPAFHCTACLPPIASPTLPTSNCLSSPLLQCSTCLPCIA